MKTAVISIDLINELCDNKGSILGFSERIADNNIFDNANRVLAWARQRDYLIIHCRMGFRIMYPDCSGVSPIFRSAKKYGLLQQDSWGCEYHPLLQREAGDIDIIKHRVSPFYGTDLEVILRSNDIKRLVLLGVATNNAVELTAREAHDRDYKINIVSDACETSNDDLQQNSLVFMSQFSDISSADAPDNHNPNWQSHF